jgi:hypothetical protein
VIRQKGVYVLIATLFTVFVFSVAQDTRLTHQQSLDSLAPWLATNAITLYSSGKCSDRETKTCTSLEQIREATLLRVIELHLESSCELVITGGTEVGHSSGTHSHYNGYKIDVRLSTCVDQYVVTHFTYAGLRGDGAELYKDVNGNEFAREANHWDITVF